MKNRTKIKTLIAVIAIAPMVLLGSACTPAQDQQADPAPVTQTVTAPPATSQITPPSTLFPPDTAEGDRSPQQQAPAPKPQGPTQGPQQGPQQKAPEDMELAPLPAGKTSINELTDEEYADLVFRTAALDNGITVPIGKGLPYASAACGNFDEGATLEQNVYAAHEAFSDTNLTLEDHAYLIGVSIGLLCPEYESLVE